MHNVGKVDRIIRVSLAAILVILYFTGIVTGNLGTILIVLAGILLATSLRRCCPLYAVLGMGTCGTGNNTTEPTIKTGKLDV